MEDTGAPRTRLALSIAGFMATAVTYGPARMGFGLFLPTFRDVFDLSTQSAGFIASIGFFGFLVAIPLSGLLTAKSGPRRSIILGGCLASCGLAMVAVAQNPEMLTLGIALAGASAGLSWSPYNNAAERLIDPGWRPRSLSIISTGTTVGVALAGLLALFAAHYGFSWRLPWIIFAAISAVMTLYNFVALRPVAGSAGAGVEGQNFRPGEVIRALLKLPALPLFAAAFSFSFTTSIYLSFAVDHMTASGGLPGVSPEVTPASVFIAFGVTGLIGIYTSDLEEKIGLVWLLRMIFLGSASALATVALAPTSWPAALFSAGLIGACVMTISAAKAFWSERLFPSLPAVSFTAVILVSALGAVLGPSIAATLSEIASMQHAFLAAASLSLLTVLLLPRRLMTVSAHPGRENAT